MIARMSPTTNSAAKTQNRGCPISGPNASSWAARDIQPGPLTPHPRLHRRCPSRGAREVPETKCGVSAVLDTRPAVTTLGCRKPAWRRSGRVVSGQRGAWISSSPDSADASRGRLLCRKATALRAGSDLRWYCATTPNQTAPSKWFSIAFAVSRRFLRPFITIIGANSLKIPLGIISSS
jgi:hypothetical protein